MASGMSPCVHLHQHSVHWGINPTPSTTIPCFLPSPPPLKSANNPTPHFRQSPLYIGFS